MKYLALPLRIDTDFTLRTTDAEEMVTILLTAMFRTPGGTFPFCPAFGVRELLEDATPGSGTWKPALLDEAMDRMNEVFAKYTGAICRIEALQPAEENSKTPEFVAKLVMDSGTVHDLKVPLLG